MKECGHLASGHRVFRTEPGVPFYGVAAQRHSGSTNPVDVALEHGGIVIDEVVAATIVGVPHRTDKQRGELAASQRLIRAVLVVGRRVAASGDSGCRQPRNVAGKDGVLGIREVRW